MKIYKPEIWAYKVESREHTLYSELIKGWKIRIFGRQGILGEAYELNKWLRVHSSFQIIDMRKVQDGVEPIEKYNKIWEKIFTFSTNYIII